MLKSSALLRKIDTLRFSPYIIVFIYTYMLRDIVYTRVSLSHQVDVFQWDRECVIIWVVKASIEFFMMVSIDKSLHS